MDALWRMSALDSCGALTYFFVFKDSPHTSQSSWLFAPTFLFCAFFRPADWSDLVQCCGPSWTVASVSPFPSASFLEKAALDSSSLSDIIGTGTSIHIKSFWSTRLVMSSVYNSFATSHKIDSEGSIPASLPSDSGSSYSISCRCPTSSVGSILISVLPSADENEFASSIQNALLSPSQ